MLFSTTAMDMLALLLTCLICWRSSLAVPAPKHITEDPSWSPLTVAQCRATCLREFSATLTRDSLCMQDPDCFMCWQNCELLHSNWSVWGAMCSEKTVCFPGCRQACRFFLEVGAADPPPLSATRVVGLLLVSDAELRWPAVPDATHLVYVVMWRPNGTSRWVQVKQTLDCGAQLPTAPGAVRVLVVDPGGLLTVYTPAVGEAAAPVRVLASSGNTVNKPIADPNTNYNWLADTVDDGEWVVRVGSVIHQGVLVIAELSWRAPSADLKTVTNQGGSGLYLVTWEVDGGGITGNLYTDNTCVTLSLWPNTVFHIQVELVWRSSAVSRSGALLVDTSNVQPAGPQPWYSMLVPVLVLAGEAATVLYVAVVCCRSCWRRWRAAAQRSDKTPLVQQEEAPHKDPEL